MFRNTSVIMAKPPPQPPPPPPSASVPLRIRQYYIPALYRITTVLHNVDYIVSYMSTSTTHAGRLQDVTLL